MSDDEREWLLRHLDDQAADLRDLTSGALQNPDDPAWVTTVCDAIFTMRETLDTLGVAYALVGNDEWNRIIGTEIVGD
jgi:hypothetical protein